MIKFISLGDTNISKAYLGSEIIYSSSFNPLELFKDGKQGVWLDPSDKSTLFQDVAGTVPVTTDGDPVALMKDKSGNDNHATQTVSAARPIYKTNGILHWIEYDGTDDNMSFGDIVFAGKTAGLGIAVRHAAGTSSMGAVLSAATGTGWYYGLHRQGDSSDVSTSPTRSTLNGKAFSGNRNDLRTAFMDTAVYTSQDILYQSGNMQTVQHLSSRVYAKLYGFILTAYGLDPKLKEVEQYLATKAGVIL